VSVHRNSDSRNRPGPTKCVMGRANRPACEQDARFSSQDADIIQQRPGPSEPRRRDLARHLKQLAGAKLADTVLMLVPNRRASRRCLRTTPR
jgi:hypothetical protein